MDVLQWSRHYRCFPGQGALDLAGFVDRVLAAGYAGPLSLEVFNDVFRQADPERTAVDAMRSLIVLEDRPAAPPAAARRVRVRRDRRRRATRRPDTEALLRAMGFVHAGPHRSKPVQLWEHGEIRVVLNHGAGDEDPEVVGDRRRAARDPGGPRGPRRGAARARCSSAAAAPARPT